MRALLAASLLVMQLGSAFVQGPPAMPSKSLNLFSSLARSRTAVTLRSLRSPQDAASASEDKESSQKPTDVDVERLIDSLNPSDLLGQGEGKGARGLAAVASNAVADVEEPGKLLREAAQPFRDEMDRLEAELQENVSAKEEEMDRKLQEMMNMIGETE